MFKSFKKNYSLVTPVVISAAVAASAIISGAVNAETQTSSKSVNADALVEQVQLRPSAVAQNVTSVSQLSDVKPTDWAFTALQSLVERYGCIAGYPDRTFRGKQATSRYEFAAGLNACLDKINEIISAGLADKVSKEDLATLQKLQEEFAAELATLRGRVDALDAKTAKLEAQQFSTTTKLRGEAIFGLAAESATPSSSNVVFNYRVRLNLDTSFTGKDLLRTRLQASNTGAFNTFGVGNGTRLSYDGFTVSGTSANTFELNRLYYKFPIGDTFTAYVAPVGATEDVLNPLNPLQDDAQGTISRFGRFSPLIRIASGGGSTGLAVAGFDWKISDKVNLQATYSATNAAVATGAGGVTGNDTKIAAQFVLKPADSLTFGVGYANAYTNSTLNSGLGTGLNGDVTNNLLLPTTVSGIKSDTVVGSLIWDITKKFTFNTWGSWTFANFTGGSATITSWNAAISGKDLFTEGDLAAIAFGQPLYATNTSGYTSTANATPYQLEALYRFRVSKNISITPGVFFVFNPNNNSNNGTATVGVIRTTFSF
jgi:hypothetical protein